MKPILIAALGLTLGLPTAALANCPPGQPNCPPGARININPGPGQVQTPLMDRAIAMVTESVWNWSQPNRQALSQVGNYYDQRVYYYGKTLSHDAIMNDKWAFAERWPQRNYSFRANWQASYCDDAAGRCYIVGEVDFDAYSPARGKRSAGISTLELTISFYNGMPYISSETGKVIRRY